MSTHKHCDRLCYAITALMLIFCLLFMNAEKIGIIPVAKVLGYENKLFNTSKVHTIDITMDNWDEFLDNAMSETYYKCDMKIDGESYKNVAIRAKGNTSLSSVASYGNDRYSFKVEFDHYDNAIQYHGLDKLSLNNMYADNTYMKDYIAYQWMYEMGVAAPLSSFAYITVNGEDWGLYLAVEAIEESFLQRNYGNNYGELYKPDSMNFAGKDDNRIGKMDFDKNFSDNKGKFDQSKMPNMDDNARPTDRKTGSDRPNIGESTDLDKKDASTRLEKQWPNENKLSKNVDGISNATMEMQENMPTQPNSSTQTKEETAERNEFETTVPNNFNIENFDFSQIPNMGEINKDDMQNMFPNGMNDFNGISFGEMFGSGRGGMFGMGKDDVLLKYIDDNHSSYSNIFNSAKTDVTDQDKDRLIASLKKLTNKEDIEAVVDVEEVIKYFVVHNFVLNFDSYTGGMIHNYYLYEENGKMQMIPWDYNLAFGGFQSTSDATSLLNMPIDDPISSGNKEDRPMIAWIFGNDKYTEMYHSIYNEFVENYFDNGEFEKWFAKTVEMITPYVEKDPNKFCTNDEFKQGVKILKEACIIRCESIKKQLSGEIGITNETQNPETLVDASNINLALLGEMSMGGGPGGMNFGNRPNKESIFGSSDNETKEDHPEKVQEDFGNSDVVQSLNIGQEERTQEANIPPQDFQRPNGIPSGQMPDFSSMSEEQLEQLQSMFGNMDPRYIK